LVEVDGSGGGVKETSVEVLTQCSGKRSVDKFCSGHGGAIGKSDDDVVAVAARYFGEIIESDVNHGAVFRAQFATATLDSFPACLWQCCGGGLARGGGGVEGPLKIGYAPLGIGYREGSQGIFWTTYTHAPLFRFSYGQFFYPFDAISIDFFIATLVRDEFCA